MSDPFLGEIKMFAGNFAPQGFALCDGQLLLVSQNQSLFALFGTQYGGNGTVTFALPDLRGRVPIHKGSGPGLSNRSIGVSGGSEQAIISAAELPAHSHSWLASSAGGTEATPESNYLAATTNVLLYRPAAPTAALESSSVTAVGSGASHPNVMPFGCINFIVALTGVFPSS